MSHNKAPKSIQVFIFFFSTLPACFLAVLILWYGVNVPYWDQWDIAPFFEKLSQGSLTFADLFAQFNEYRQFFPNAIFVILGWLTRWDVRFEMYVTFLLACLVSFNLYRLCQATFSSSAIQRSLVLLFTNLLVFSPIQYENWLFGVQIVYFMPIACITTCMTILYSGISPKVKYLTAACLCTISTFSSANGILSWLVIVPILMQTLNDSVKKRKLFLGWGFGFCLATVIYLYGDGKPLQHPSVSAPLAHPFQTVIYFINLLGSPVALSWMYISTVTGLALLTIYVLVIIYVLRARESDLWCRTNCWIMLGVYSVLTAFMITIGRSQLGLKESLISRYTTFTICLSISLIYLVPIVLNHSIVRGRWIKSKTLASRLMIALAAIFIMLHLLSATAGVRGMFKWRQLRLQGKAQLLFINFFPVDCSTNCLYPDSEVLKKKANALDQLDFLSPRLIQSVRVLDIEGNTNQTPSSYGLFESLNQDNHDIFTASGWAVLPGTSEPADAVLLAFESENESMVFTMTVTKLFGHFNLDSLNQSKDLYSRWQKTFSRSALPDAPMRITAWAFDASTGKAYRLNGEHMIEKPDK